MIFFILEEIEVQLHKNSLSRYEKTLIFSVFVIIWATIFISSKLYWGGFNFFLDDHTILSIYNQHKNFKEIILDPFLYVLKNANIPRFRPMYDVFLNFFTAIYGLNPFLWYLSSSLMAISISFIFYIIGRKIKLSVIATFLFVLLIIFGPQSSTYARFGTPETTSMLLIGLSWLLASLDLQNKKYQIISDGGALLLAILAALNKEACILMLPALAIFKVWYTDLKNNVGIFKSIKKNVFFISFLVLATLFFLVYIKLRHITGPGYAPASKNAFTIHNIIGSFENLNARTFLSFAIFFNLFYILIQFISGKWKQFRFWGYYLLVASIIFPQVVVYSQTSFNWHYLYPVAIGISLLCVYPFTELSSRNTLITNILTVIIVVIVMRFTLTQIHQTYAYFQGVAKQTAVQKILIKDLQNKISRDDTILIVGNPYMHYEKLSAFNKILKIILKNDSSYFASYSTNGSYIKNKSDEEHEKKLQFINPKEVEKWYENKTFSKISNNELANIKVIILLSPSKIKKDFLKRSSTWFDESKYSYKKYDYNDLAIYYLNTNKKYRN